MNYQSLDPKKINNEQRNHLNLHQTIGHKHKNNIQNFALSPETLPQQRFSKSQVSSSPYKKQIFIFNKQTAGNNFHNKIGFNYIQTKKNAKSQAISKSTKNYISPKKMVPSFLTSNIANQKNRKYSQRSQNQDENKKIQNIFEPTVTVDKDKINVETKYISSQSKFANIAKSSQSSQESEPAFKENIGNQFNRSNKSQDQNNTIDIKIVKKIQKKVKSVCNMNITKVPAFLKKISDKQKQSKQDIKQTILNDQQDKKSQEIVCGFQINIKPAVKKWQISDFQVVKMMGKGTFGEAYLALEKATGFLCILKTISKQRLKTQKLQQYLKREIIIQSYLYHHHITNLYGSFNDDDNIYIVMEFLFQGSLKTTLKKKSLTQEQISKILAQVCEAVQYLHNNYIIHRDIKLENIFMHEEYAKLGDFGCSVYSTSLRKSVIGSPYYLSPEQLRSEEYDQKVDSWSIGVMTYEMLFQSSPFQKEILEIMENKRGPNLPLVLFPSRVEVSEQAKDFIKKLLEPDTTKRMSVSGALSHKFITKYKKDDDKQDIR